MCPGAGIAPAEDEVMEEEALRTEASLRKRLAGRIPAPGHIRERLPKPIYLVAGAAAVALIAVVAVTGAFGLIGGDEEKGGRKDKPVKPSRVDVAVLNGTAASGSVGTPGLAETVSRDVKSAGYDVGAVGDAGSFANTFVMYGPGHEEEARAVAADLDKQLENLKVDEMTPEVKGAAGGAEVAVVIGLDNSQL